MGRNTTLMKKGKKVIREFRCTNEDLLNKLLLIGKGKERELTSNYIKYNVIRSKHALVSDSACVYATVSMYECKTDLILH